MVNFNATKILYTILALKTSRDQHYDERNYITSTDSLLVLKVSVSEVSYVEQL